MKASLVITHTTSLEHGPEMYRTFRDKSDGCIKVVLKPNGSMSGSIGNGSTGNGRH